MPIYEYRCKACGHRLEELQKITELPLTVCPVCGKPGLERLVSHTSFQLKGTGWYATDFKNNDNKTAKTTEGVQKEEVKDKTETSAAAGEPAPAKPAESKPKEE